MGEEKMVWGDMSISWYRIVRVCFTYRSIILCTYLDTFNHVLLVDTGLALFVYLSPTSRATFNPYY